MRTGLILFLIISLGIIIYSNSLGGDFIWDDVAFTIYNDFIKDLRFIPVYFVSKHTLAQGTLASENYRPLLPLSYAVDYFFWKLNPLGYHLSNLFFHIVNAILVFYLVQSLTKNKLISSFTSLFFLTHPIQTESVTWISGRADVLFLFFYLAALIAYVNYTRSRRFILYFAALLLFSCSLLSKEMAVSFPLILILYDVFYPAHIRKRLSDSRHCEEGAKRLTKQSPMRLLRALSYPSGTSRPRNGIIVIRYFPFLLILEVYVILRFNIIGKLAQYSYWTGDIYTTLLTMARGIVYYIRLLIYPVGLCADYLTFPASQSIREPGVFLSIAAITLLITCAIKLAKRNRHISFSIFWFFLTLSPVANLIPIKILIAERFLYLPSIGYCLVAATLVALLFDKFKKTHLSKYSVICFAGFLVFAYSYLTIARNSDWSDEVTFFKKVALKYPDNFRAHLNLSVAYSNRGEMEKSYEETKKALEVAPEDYPSARKLLAKYYIKNDRFDDAIKECKQILKTDPHFLEAYTLLAIIYEQQEKYDLAYNEYRKALALNPNSIKTKLFIASLYLLKGDIDSGIMEYNDILKEPPPYHQRSIYAAAYLRLGDLYVDTGDNEGATRAWRKVYEDFKDQIWFHEISKFLIGKTDLQQLLRKTESWQPEFKTISYYYVGIKKEVDGNLEEAAIYYNKSRNTAAVAVDYIKMRAAERLEKIKKGADMQGPQQGFQKYQR